MTSARHTRRPAFSAALRLATLLLALSACATLLALLARWSWFFELFTHFRPIYLLVQALLLAGLLLAGRRLLVTCAALLVLTNLLWVGPYLPVPAGAALNAQAATQPLAIIALNLYHRNHQHERVLAYLRERAPDVLVLSELTPAWQQALAALEPGYPYRLLVPQAGSQGIGVYSRLPLAAAEATDLGHRGSNNVQARLLLPGGSLDLFAVHLATPVSPGRARGRNAQLEALAARLAERRDESAGQLLVGDLNVTPFSPYFRDLLREAGLVDPARRHGLILSWPALWLPPLIAIDHVLVSPELRVLDLRAGPRVGSDHLPVEVLLEVGGLPAPGERA